MARLKLTKPDEFDNYWLDDVDHNRCRAAIFPHKLLKDKGTRDTVVHDGKWSALCDIGRFLEDRNGERMFFDTPKEALAALNDWLETQE